MVFIWACGRKGSALAGFGWACVRKKGLWLGNGTTCQQGLDSTLAGSAPWPCGHEDVSRILRPQVGGA